MTSARNRQTKDESALPLEWSCDEGRLCVRPKGKHPFGLTGLSGSVSIDGRPLSLHAAQPPSGLRRETSDGGETIFVAEFAFDEPAVRWQWRFEDDDGAVRVSARLVNVGDRPVAVADWDVLHLERDCGGTIDLGRRPESVRFFAWRPWNVRVERIGTDDGNHQSNNLCLLYDPDSDTSWLCGFVTLDRMLVRHNLEWTAQAGVGSYRATCVPGGHSLAPGRTLESETLVLRWFPNPYAALEDWADQVHDMYQPPFDDAPPVCWGGSAWINAYSETDRPWETVLFECIEALREKLGNFAVDLVTGTTHRMYKDGLPGNWLTVDERQVPSGLDALGKKLWAKGFAHKFWFSPFWFFDEAEETRELSPDCLLKDESGVPITAAANWEFDHNADPDGARRLTKYFLDGTHPATREYLRAIFEAYRRIGVRAYMLDFLAIPHNAKLHDDSLLPVEAARQILKYIREAVGDDTHLQTAVASTPGFIGLIDAARVGRDFGEGRPLYPPYNAWRNATYALHDNHFGNAFSFVQNAAANYFTHRKIYVNDFNMLTIDKPVPLEHARIATTLFGLGGGTPLVLGDDIRHVGPERLRMIKLCLPRTRGVPVPVDLFERVAPQDYCRILKLPVETSWDSYMLVAMFNFDDQASQTPLDFAQLGLAPDEAHAVFEFWNGEYVGTFRQRVPCEIPANACRVYRISQARPHPWLLATDLHMQQGLADIQSLAWDPDTMTLAGTAARPPGERGNLFFVVPRMQKLVNHEGVCLMKDVRDMNVVARMPVCFEEDTLSFELRFETMDTQYLTRNGWLPYATEQEWLDYEREHRDPTDTRVME